MLKKIIYIFFLSILTQLFSVFSLSYIIKNGADNNFIENIALLDSAFAIITTVLAFGILQIATRDIVGNENWKSIVKETQEDRSSFAIVLLIIGIVLYLITFNNLFLILTIAPLISSNVNYALYAQGYSIYATIASSIRILIPSIALLLFGYYQNYSNFSYFIIFIISLLFSSQASIYFLKTTNNFKFKRDFYKKYIRKINIGITDLAIIFLEMGILFFAAFFYTDLAISNSYMILKIYVLIKGIQRLIFQIFYNELTNNEKVIFYNKIIFLVGFVFFIISFNYSHEFLYFVFSKNDEIIVTNFKILGFSLLIASILLASMARTLVLKKDKIYIQSYNYALISTIFCMILFSFTSYKSYGISLSLLMGEFVLFTSFFIKIRSDYNINNYLFFFLFQIVLLVIYTIIKFYFTFTLSIVLTLTIQFFYCFYFLFYNKKQIF